MSDLIETANRIFYQWEIDNSEQDLSDRDRNLWTAGWVHAWTQAQNQINTNKGETE